MTAIAVLGLGAMGSRLAINYATAGHAVTVWNRTPDRHQPRRRQRHDRCRLTRSPTQSASRRRRRHGQQRRSRGGLARRRTGALASMRPDTVAIESSTLTAAPCAASRRHRPTAAAIRFVEAPVVGSRPQADAGALFYLLGGDAEAIDAALPIIDVNAGNSTRVGKLGNAAVMKLAINGLFAAQVAAYAEIVGLHRTKRPRRPKQRSPHCRRCPSPLRACSESWASSRPQLRTELPRPPRGQGPRLPRRNLREPRR